MGFFVLSLKECGLESTDEELFRVKTIQGEVFGEHSQIRFYS